MQASASSHWACLSRLAPATATPFAAPAGSQSLGFAAFGSSHQPSAISHRPSAISHQPLRCIRWRSAFRRHGMESRLLQLAAAPPASLPYCPRVSCPHPASDMVPEAGVSSCCLALENPGALLPLRDVGNGAKGGQPVCCPCAHPLAPTCAHSHTVHAGFLISCQSSAGRRRTDVFPSTDAGPCRSRANSDPLPWIKQTFGRLDACSQSIISHRNLEMVFRSSLVV